MAERHRSAAGNGQEAQEEACSLFIQDVREFTSVLSALKIGNKQACSITIAPEGFSVRLEDDSKILQVSVFLPAQVFARYSVPPGAHFSLAVQLNALLDVLAIFSSMATSTSTRGLELKYPGEQGELQCGLEGLDDRGNPSMAMYASVSSVVQPHSRDLFEFWQPPTSQVLTSGALMREAVEDLEWPAADVTLCLSAPPNRLRLSAYGVAGSLEVELPTSELTGFELGGLDSHAPPDSTQGASIEHAYKYRAMRAAFCCLTSHRDRDGASASSSCKLSIDVAGILKVTHMVELATGQWTDNIVLGRHGGQQGATQRLAERSAVITVVTIPVVDERAE